MLGSLAQRSVWIHCSLFLLGWIAFWVFPWTLRVANAERIPALGHALLLFAHVTLTPLVGVLVPSVIGVRRGRKQLTMTASGARILATAVSLLVALQFWSSTWRARALHDWSEGVYAVQAIDWTDLAIRTAFLTWPMLYILATAKRQAVPAR